MCHSLMKTWPCFSLNVTQGIARLHISFYAEKLKKNGVLMTDILQKYAVGIATHYWLGGPGIESR